MRIPPMVLPFLMGVLLCAGLAPCGAASSLGRFFRPASDRAAGMAPDGLYPQGQRLLFSLYSIRSGDWDKEGFTAIGPYYGAQSGGGQFAPHAGVVDAARALDVRCLYRVGMEIPFLKEYKMPSDEEITTAITDQVRAAADRPEIAVWYVTPEELRCWRPDEMRYLKVATEAIRAADPRCRPVMLYEPNHRNAAALGRTLPFLDISSKGMYANSVGFKENRAWIRWGVEQEVQAIADVKPAAAPYSVLWMAGDPDPAEVPLIRAWTRHDVYLSLVAGAKGIVIWSGFRRAKFTSFDEYLNGYAACARELNGTPNLARVFLFGEPRRDLRVRVADGPKTVVVEYQKQKHTYPSVSHLDVALGEERWLFLVNSAPQAVTVTVDGLPSRRLYRQDAFAPAEPEETTRRLEGIEMAPLDVRGWRFVRSKAP